MKKCDTCNGFKVCGVAKLGQSACAQYQCITNEKMIREMSVTRMAAFLVGISQNCLNPKSDLCLKQGCPLAGAENCRRAGSVVEFLFKSCDKE